MKKRVYVYLLCLSEDEKEEDEEEEYFLERMSWQLKLIARLPILVSISLERDLNGHSIPK